MNVRIFSDGFVCKIDDGQHRCRHGHPGPGVGASSRDGYLRAPSPSSRRAAGRVGVSHATARPSGAPAAAPAAGRPAPSGLRWASTSQHERPPGCMMGPVTRPGPRRHDPHQCAGRTEPCRPAGAAARHVHRQRTTNPIPPPQPLPRRPGTVAEFRGIPSWRHRTRRRSGGIRDRYPTAGQPARGSQRRADRPLSGDRAAPPPWGDTSTTTWPRWPGNSRSTRGQGLRLSPRLR